MIIIVYHLKEDKEIKKMKYNKYKYDITCIL